MDTELIPTQKDKNIFWMQLMASVPLAIIAGFFTGSFFLLPNIIKDNYMVLLMFYLNMGLFLLVLMAWMKNKIVPVKSKNYSHKTSTLPL